MRKPPTLATRTGQRSRSNTSKHAHLYRLSRWRKASEAFRSTPEGALCRPCQARGRIVPSALTDHVVPHRGDLTLFWSPSNWQGMCWSCHSAKSRADVTGKPHHVRGCDPSGIPLDPSHFWHRNSDA